MRKYSDRTSFIMKQFILALCVMSFFVLSGCANLQIPFLGKSSNQAKIPDQSDSHEKEVLEPNEYVDKGRIVNAQRLKEGKNLAIIPFKAGVDVEANEELDKTALMIVKGISDAFAEDHTGKHAYFNILTAENSSEANLIAKGHIVKMTRLSKIRRWISFNRKKILSVSGKITDIKTGETVLIFTDHAESNVKSEEYRELGYRIGKNIGRFILSGV